MQCSLTRQNAYQEHQGPSQHEASQQITEAGQRALLLP